MSSKHFVGPAQERLNKIAYRKAVLACYSRRGRSLFYDKELDIHNRRSDQTINRWPARPTIPAKARVAVVRRNHSVRLYLCIPLNIAGPEKVPGELFG